MTLHMTCPHCAAKLKLGSTDRASVRCPKCKQAFKVAKDAAGSPQPRAGAAEGNDSATLSKEAARSKEPAADINEQAAPSAPPKGSAIKKWSGWIKFVAYILCTTGLGYVTFSWLHFHWFWAGTFALTASSWLVFGLPPVVMEGSFAQKTVDRWVSEGCYAKTIVDELNKMVSDDKQLKGDAIVLGFNFALAVAILFCHLVPWTPQSFLSYLGFVVVGMVIVPLAALGIFCTAAEERLGFRWNRVLAVLRKTDNQMCQGAVEWWERDQAWLEKKEKREEAAAEKERQEQEQAASEGRIAGIKIPPGQFTRGLAASDYITYEMTIDAISALAQNGRRNGLDELEALIKANVPSWARGNCDFQSFDGYQDDLQYDSMQRRLEAAGADREFMVKDLFGKLLTAIEKGGLLGHIRKAQSAIYLLNLRGKLKQARDEVKKAGGEREARWVDLLYSQASIAARYSDALGI